MERFLWMYNLSRLDPLYIPEVHRFVDAAKNHALRTKTKHIIVHALTAEILFYLKILKQSFLI